ncbi:MAG TPA: hypothetical protein VLY63_18850 [Anaerolineae bacterium]|nr:hypothetical protein [Anaerolineae bacterium]
MVTTSDFLPDDQRRLEAILEISSRQAGSPRTIEALVEQWTTFVDELQSGYCRSRGEYEEDLSVRALLEEICECLSADGRGKLVAALLEPDRRFLSLTVRVNGSLRRNWWNRFPEDLAA